MLRRIVSRQLLKTFMDRDFATSLGNLLQHLVNPTAKIVSWCSEETSCVCECCFLSFHWIILKRTWPVFFVPSFQVFVNTDKISPFIFTAPKACDPICSSEEHAFPCLLIQWEEACLHLHYLVLFKCKYLASTLKTYLKAYWIPFWKHTGISMAEASPVLDAGEDNGKDLKMFNLCYRNDCRC